VTVAGAVAAILIPKQPQDKACVELEDFTEAQLSPQRP
jgi:hypothetical protein